MTKPDPVNHPSHYDRCDTHPSGVECIEIVECMPFCWGNAFKYLYRAEHKAKLAEDYRKAAWYLRRAAKWDAVPWNIEAGSVLHELLQAWRDGEAKPRKRVLSMLIDAALQQPGDSTQLSRLLEAATQLEAMALLIEEEQEGCT